MSPPRTIPSFRLNNGRTMPVIGLGTWQSPPDGTVYRAVREALDAGYRLLDCALVYGNHPEIGKAIQDAIKDGVVKREDLFITSKVWPTYFRPDRVPLCAKKILVDLQLDYLDLLLLHVPVSLQQQDETLFPMDPKTGLLIDGKIDFVDAYRGLEEVAAKGLARSIGVSNFTVDQLKRLLAVAKVKPVTNQVEMHPYLVQPLLKAFCDAQGIVITAYSPLGNPGSNVPYNPRADHEIVMREPFVGELAHKYGKTLGQILIRYQLDRGNVVIPKSVRKERIISNLDVFDFELTPAEVTKLDSLNRCHRTCPLPVLAHLENYPF